MTMRSARILSSRHRAERHRADRLAASPADIEVDGKDRYIHSGQNPCLAVHAVALRAVVAAAIPVVAVIPKLCVVSRKVGIRGPNELLLKIER
jgi:hypothetical protein